MKTAKQNAINDGYNYTGIWERSYKRDEVKARAVELRKQGFLARVIDDNGGFAVYTKDTPRTLAAKAEAAKLEEERRVLAAADFAKYLRDLADAAGDLKMHTINSLRSEMTTILNRGW